MPAQASRAMDTGRTVEQPPATRQETEIRRSMGAEAKGGTVRPVRCQQYISRGRPLGATAKIGTVRQLSRGSQDAAGRFKGDAISPGEGGAGLAQGAALVEELAALAGVVADQETPAQVDGVQLTL